MEKQNLYINFSLYNVIMVQTKKRKHTNTKTRKSFKVYSKEDYKSSDGMLTSVWGPSLWHYLHTMSFNYPVNPSMQEKKQYKEFILSLKNVLPCKYCRENLKNNLKSLPLTKNALKNRENFSKYVYDLHELINKMLGKKSNLSYTQVRERYEHFRSRCTIDIKNKKISNLVKKTLKRKRKKENGCITPLYGKKSKCVIKIVPHDENVNTFQIDKKCIKRLE